VAFDFSVDPDFQLQLDWAREFVRADLYPLDLLWPHENSRRSTTDAVQW
jgi:acyl-CoA dehydrogenase